MTFDLSRRHWWNPTLEELSVEGERWASNQLELNVITSEEYVEYLIKALPEYKIELCDLSIFQHPRYQPDVSLGYDPWAPMRHWDD